MALKSKKTRIGLAAWANFWHPPGGEISTFFIGMCLKLFIICFMSIAVHTNDDIETPLPHSPKQATKFAWSRRSGPWGELEPQIRLGLRKSCLGFAWGEAETARGGDKVPWRSCFNAPEVLFRAGV